MGMLDQNLHIHDWLILLNLWRWRHVPLKHQQHCPHGGKTQENQNQHCSIVSLFKSWKRFLEWFSVILTYTGLCAVVTRLLFLYHLGL
jgi:hypothetical protein